MNLTCHQIFKFSIIIVYMFEKIKNPTTGKWVNINSNTGKRIINQFKNQIAGGLTNYTTPIDWNNFRQNNSNKDAYEILGVPRNASQDEIKKKARKGYLLYHPDKIESNKKTGKLPKDLTEKEIVEMFNSIKEAGAILHDTDQGRHKAAYDRWLNQNPIRQSTKSQSRTSNSSQPFGSSRPTPPPFRGNDFDPFGFGRTGRARQEADRRARQEADRRARQEADRRARQEADRRARQEADRRARQEADRRAREASDAKARQAARKKQKQEEIRKREAEVRRRAEEDQRQQAIRRARQEEERRARQEEERRARQEEERRARQEEVRRARQEEERRARQEADQRRKKKQEEIRRREAEVRRRAAQDQRQKAEEKLRRQKELAALKQKRAELSARTKGIIEYVNNNKNKMDITLEQINTIKQAYDRHASELQTVGIVGASEAEKKMIEKDMNTLLVLIKEVEKTVKEINSIYKYERNTALRNGNDLTPPQYMTVREALRVCNSIPQCSGFTFNDRGDTNLDTYVTIYTKSPQAGPFGLYNPSVTSSDWHSFTKLNIK
jgi:curved DNA-binding protein CbpA